MDNINISTSTNDLFYIIGEQQVRIRALEIEVLKLKALLSAYQDRDGPEKNKETE